jgi:hypothetical protein
MCGHLIKIQLKLNIMKYIQKAKRIKINIIVFTLCASFSSYAQHAIHSEEFDVYVKNIKLYTSPLLPENFKNEEFVRIDIPTYNKVFVNYVYGEQYYYNSKGEHYDDNVSGYMAEYSINKDITKEQYKNYAGIFGRLFLNSNFETFIFKYETYDSEYVILNNYTRKGNLLSSICLIFKEKQGDTYIYSDIKGNNDIWIYTVAQESIDEEISLKIFVLDADGHFRVIKSYFDADAVNEEEITKAKQQIKNDIGLSRQDQTNENETFNDKQKITYSTPTILTSTSDKQFKVVEGDTFDGEMKEGRIVNGRIYDKNGNVKHLILPKRNH